MMANTILQITAQDEAMEFWSQTPSIVRLDQEITLAMNECHNEFWDQTMWHVSHGFTWVAGTLMMLYLVLKTKPKYKEAVIFLLFVAVMILCADQLCNLFKHTVQRFRPCWDPYISHLVHIVNDDRGGKYGFFSAHAAIFFGLAFMSSRLFQNKAYTIGIYLTAAIVSYSRIYLGRHYLGDVLAGAAAGTLVAWGAWYFYQKFRDKLMKTHKRQKAK